MNRQSPDRQPNRLARETSPYLLQHAFNPVDWYAWGPEAFAAARQRDVPIFLSIGYSTCYWCHVMERESFENTKIAAVMNSHFVCVKVDREERPDVDDLYMTATQAMTGGGGWPMSVFLEPRTLKPFWCGTYFPPESRWGKPGFPELLMGIADAWKKQREDVGQQADELAEAVRERLAARHAPVKVNERQVATAVGQLLKIHDRVHGGFGEAPKFPQPVYLELLVRFAPHAGDEETAGAVEAAIRQALDGMALGGIFDQVGGGFHRYSVDEKWLVPHFEKMLYDNAQLVEVYAKASRLYGDALYARTAARTLEYVLREMLLPDGAFASAQDAEVNHREGQNYLWTREQLLTVLGEEDGAFAAKVYGVDAGPNFRDPHHPNEAPSNVLFLPAKPAALAASLRMEEGAFLTRLDAINAALAAARATRDQPGRDDKIIAGWNGLMIAALAAAGRALGRPDFVDAARRAAGFILGSMWSATGGLMRTYRRLPEAGAGPAARIPAFLEDYAMLIHGLIELHRADGGSGEHLASAVRLLAEAERAFADPKTGGYFDTRAEQADLFVRGRSEYDGAIPCGSSVMLNNLLDLAPLTGDPAHLRRAGECLASLSAFVSAAPVGAANSTRGLLRLLTEQPATLAAALKDAREPGTPESAGPVEQPVAVYAAVERVTVTSTQAGGLILQMRIAEGYHVNAADPGPGGAALQGLRVKVVNGSGVEAYAEYPAGEPYRPTWWTEAEEIMVYRGTVSIPVVIERTGAAKGTPLLAVTYQACTDESCMAPATLELAVSIDVED